MGEGLFYVILHSVVAFIGYTIIVYFGYRKSVKEYKERKLYLVVLQSLVAEIKHLVHKEEPNMLDKGNYKNTRSSEFRKTEESKLTVKNDAQLRLEAGFVKNTLTLTDLVTRKPTEEDYAEVLALLIKLAKDTYEKYKFYIALSPDKTEPNFLQIVSHSSEAPHIHKLIFSKSVSYGLDMRVLQEKFAQKAAAGDVIDLGEDVTVIVNDGSNSLPTGVSPTNNGLEGGEIAFIISFIKTDNFGEWHDKTFPKKDESNE